MTSFHHFRYNILEVFNLAYILIYIYIHICIIRTYFHACKIIDCTGLRLREPCHQLIECSRKLRSCGLLVTVSLLSPLDVKLCVFCRFVIWSLFGKRPETSLANWGSRDNYEIPLVKFLEKAWGRKVFFWKGPGWSQSLQGGSNRMGMIPAGHEILTTSRQCSATPKTAFLELSNFHHCLLLSRVFYSNK